MGNKIATSQVQWNDAEPTKNHALGAYEYMQDCVRAFAFESGDKLVAEQLLSRLPQPAEITTNLELKRWYCSLQVGCHSQWIMLDSVVSMVDIVWLALAIHGLSALRNRSLSRESDSTCSNSCALSQASSSCGAVALQDCFQQKQLANSDGIGIRAYALRLM